jgi:hypothetical protein
MHKQLDVLMQREMTRKEFVATLGFGAATLFGFGSIIKFLKPAPQVAHAKTSNGYGSRSYGV